MSANLEVENLGIRFGGLAALTDFNLQLLVGQIQGLIGPNGAGKTTLFNLLTGVYVPTQGLVRVAGTRIDGMAPHRINRLGLARTFQNIRLFRRLSVLDNVRVARTAGSGPRPSPKGKVTEALGNYYDWWRALLATPGHAAEEREIREGSEQILSVMGLLHRKDEPADSLSYGEQRRLEIARALATRPKVLLLDEPAAGMNTREKADLVRLLSEIRQRFELGILLIEHDMKLVMGVCERITVLDHGETIAVGSPEQVQSDPKVIEAYLGTSAEGRTQAPPRGEQAR